MKPRRPLKIPSRSSSITNAFVQAIIPAREFSAAEMEEAFSILEILIEAPTCAYCGDAATDLDHLRPIVRNKRPTGFITEIRNLVPACGPCNQSKSGQAWHAWITGPASKSPSTRGVPELETRIRRLQEFENWGAVRPIDFADLLPDGELDDYWAKLDEIHASLDAAQVLADDIRRRISAGLGEVAR